MILYICYHNPFGSKGGGVLASHAYLRAFCELFNGQLDLICASSVENEVSEDIKCHKIIYVDERSRKEKILSVFTGYMNRYVSFTKNWLKEHPNKYNYIVFDHSNISGTLVKTANSLGIKTITIHHNYEKEYFSDNNRGLYRLLFLHHVIKWERKAYRNSDLNLFLTKQDQSTFERVYGHQRGKSFVGGAFEYNNYSLPSVYPRSEKKLSFVITGSLSNYQTTDAITYFFSDLYGYLPLDCRVIIAGRNPSKKVLDLSNQHKNVIVIPNPEDMDEVVSQADIYICATRIGGGLKLRVMDGLKNGLPVITHVCSARGFDAFEDEPVFKKFNSPEEFDRGLTELIKLCQSGQYNKGRIQEIYRKHFSFDAGLKRLEQSFALL
jgi:glycosyltransferase involved in cell wall biosynthesis